MRTSHRQIQQLIRERQNNITDKEFFVSEAYRLFLTDLAETLTSQYNRPPTITTCWEEDGGTAYTDNRKIALNCGNRVTVQFKNRRYRHESILGLLVHECGHILFTDFQSTNRYFSQLQKKEIPSFLSSQRATEETKAWKEIMELLKTGTDNLRQIFLSFLFNILNILEDYYVENCICAVFPGYIPALKINNRLIYQNQLSLSAMLEKGYDNHSLFIALLLQYTLGKKIKNDENCQHELLQCVNHCIPMIEDCTYQKVFSKRLKAAFQIVCIVWQIIQSEMKQKAQNQQKDNQSDTRKQSHQNQQEDNRSGTREQSHQNQQEDNQSDTRKQSHQNQQEDNQSDTRKQSHQNQQKDNQSGTKEQSHQNQQEDTQSGTREQSYQNQQRMEQSNIPTNQNDNDKLGISLFPKGRGKPVAMKQELNKKELQQKQEDIQKEMDRSLLYTEVLYTGGQGGIERTTYNAQDDMLDSISKSIAQREVVEQAEQNLLKELQHQANTIRLGNAHKNVKIILKRMINVPDSYIQEYQKNAGKLEALGKQMAKKLQYLLQSRINAYKLSGFYSGNRLNSKAMLREDAKLFYKNVVPQKTSLAVAVLIDQSGSMKGKRIEAARNTGIILNSFCDYLKIPVFIAGHESNGLNTDIYLYREYDAYDQQDKYRLLDMNTHGRGNRDGAAIRYVSERLLERSEHYKLLFLISDGLPNAYGYKGTAAEEDLRGIKKEYTSKGILFFTAAIGEDKASIQRIYKNGFLDITDINILPVKLVALVSKYVKG